MICPVCYQDTDNDMRYHYKCSRKIYSTTEPPENESRTMMIAQYFGLKTVSHRLIYLESGELSYITKRVDRVNAWSVQVQISPITDSIINIIITAKRSFAENSFIYFYRNGNELQLWN